MRRHPVSNLFLIGLGAMYIGTILPTGSPAATKPPRPERARSDKWPADSLEFVGGQRYSLATKIPDAPGLSNFVHVGTKPNSSSTSVNLDFCVDAVRTPGVNTPWDFARFDFTLEPEQVVSMLGGVYTVADISGNPIRVKLVRVVDAELLKEIGLVPDSVVVPLGKGVGFRFDVGSEHSDSNTITVKTIAAAGPNGRPPEARILLEYSGGSYQPRPAVDATIAVGDVLRLLRGTRLTVRRIVPPDEKRKIVGWVELSPNPSEKPGKTVANP
jgi:hypothetical protein